MNKVNRILFELKIPLRFSTLFATQNVSFVKLSIDLKVASLSSVACRLVILFHSVRQLITQIQQNATVSSQMAITANLVEKMRLMSMYNGGMNGIELNLKMSHINSNVCLGTRSTQNPAPSTIDNIGNSACK